MYQLTTAANLCLKDKHLRHRIAELTGVRDSTVYQWTVTASPNLLRVDVLDVISEVSGLPIDQLFCKE